LVLKFAKSARVKPLQKLNVYFQNRKKFAKAAWKIKEKGRNFVAFYF
jgi:hypothetical protein